jgi:uncharacterized protein
MTSRCTTSAAARWPASIADGRQRGAIVAREAFQRDGLKAEVERVFVYTVRDGRLHEGWVYDADQALVDRFLA